MHEMSLALALMDLVAVQLTAAGATRATRLVLEIGALSHVDAHALRFALAAAAHGGPAEDAVLEILEPPGTGYCLECETSVAVRARGAPCPNCGSTHLLAQGGEELRLKQMEIV